MDDRTVVSEMGDAWSPKQAPERMDAVHARVTADMALPVTAMAMLTTTGTKMPMAEKDDPVAKAVTAATRKATVGSQWAAKFPLTIVSKYAPVPVDAIPADSVHANNKMSSA